MKETEIKEWGGWQTAPFFLHIIYNFPVAGYHPLNEGGAEALVFHFI